ncbi:hypothetical protein L3i22_020940 [Actinoplanes sp. L3-i22]|nr:hypothetical protein L3i22_020940 [Actinoplanes sp. L3-i22]
MLTGRHISFDVDGVRQLHEVCKRLSDRVIVERAQHLQTAALEEAQQTDIEDLYQRVSPRVQPPGPEAAGRARS